MRELVYYIGLSIDGFIAGPNDEIDFFPMSAEYVRWMADEYADALPTHAREQLGVADAPRTKYDTIIMGRRTYDPGLEAGITSPYAHLRQYVVSRGLAPQDPAVEIISSDPLDRVRELKVEDSELDIYFAGGGDLAGQLLPEIDRLVIKRYPVVVGAGRTAFGSTFTPTSFALDSTRTFDGGNAVATYSRTD